MKIAIIIPNYNGFDLLQKNLPKIISAIGNNREVSIIIVDDFSSLEEQKNLSHFINEFETAASVTLLKHKKNLGFSSTVNTGAFHIPADIYILLNTDVVPTKGFIEKAMKHFEEDPDLFGVGFRDLSVEDSKTIGRGRGIGTWKRGFLVHSRGETDKTNTLWISGGSSAVSGALFRELKGFDTLFNPFYWEDIDLSYRAQKRGYRVKFDPNIVVEHRHEEGAIKKHYKKRKIMTIAYRNQFIFHWKNISDPMLFLNHLLWLPIHTFVALIHGDFSFLNGLILAFFKLTSILSKRSSKRTLVSDKKIINQSW